MNLDVGYFYSTNLPEKEKLDIDKQVLTTYLKNDNKELTFNFIRFLSFLQSQKKKFHTIFRLHNLLFKLHKFPLDNFKFLSEG